ncbi:hypothetical protein DO70_2603 [Burkholderia pseudomallei]|nr:hypothetical protein DO70_2603 [Burkholderia pseudomallei]
MTPSGATHIERAALPTCVASVANVFASQSVLERAWHGGASAAISKAARSTAWIRFVMVSVASWCGPAWASGPKSA